MAYYLGIFGGEGTTNASAALTNGNKIIAFAEEERFNRIKILHHIYQLNLLFFV